MLTKLSLVFVLVFIVTTLHQCKGDGMLVGGFGEWISGANGLDQEESELKKGLENFGTAKGYTLQSVGQFRKQVVSGINYEVEAVFTDGDGVEKNCKLTIYSQSWTQTLETTKEQCS